MSAIWIDDNLFEVRCTMIEVTSIHRPDTAWVKIDAAGHEHRWFISNSKPAGYYRANETYHVPTIKWVVDGTGMYEDSEEYQYGHNECIQCGEQVVPGYRADDTVQHVPGIKYGFINGKSVPFEEFELRLEAAIRTSARK